MSNKLHNILVIGVTILLILLFAIQFFWVKNIGGSKNIILECKTKDALSAIVEKVHSYENITEICFQYKRGTTVVGYVEICKDTSQLVITNDSIKEIFYNIESDFVFDSIWREIAKAQSDNFKLVGFGSFNTSSEPLDSKKFSNYYYNDFSEYKNYITSIGDSLIIRRVGKTDEFLNIIFNVENQRRLASLSIENRLLSYDFDKIIKEELVKVDLDVDFRYYLISDTALNKLLIKEDIKQNSYYSTHLFPYDHADNSNLLVIYYPQKKLWLMKSMIIPMAFSMLTVFFIGFVIISTLIQVNKQKNEVRIKNDFINNMTHEFKTPLATISLAQSSILNPKVIGDKDKVKKFADMIRIEADKLNKHVEMILYNAKMDRGYLQLLNEEINLNILIEQIYDKFVIITEDNGGTIDICLEADYPNIVGDPVHIENAIINLLDNSNKYCKEVPKILIYTKNIASFVVIGVKDYGLGMSKETKKHAFEKFYRETTGNLHNVKGFGLGLDYVKKIADLHNAHINLESNEKVGTKIELMFPN